jgi:hypothetical protein
MAYGRRKKGGQTLMDMAKAGGVRRRAAKKAKEAAEAKRVGGKRYVTPVVKKKAAPKKKKVTPKKPEIHARKQTPTRKIPAGARSFRAAATPKRKPYRTDAQRVSDKNKFLARQKTLRKESAGMRYGSEYKGPPKLGKKEQDAMVRSMKFGVGGGAARAVGSKVLSKVAPNAVPKLKELLKNLLKKKPKAKETYESWKKDNQMRSRNYGK